jgi:hypothetical protein
MRDWLLVKRDLPDRVALSLNANHSLLTGEIINSIWQINELILSNQSLLRLSDMDTRCALEDLLEKYRNFVDLISPHSLSNFVCHGKALFTLIGSTGANEQQKRQQQIDTIISILKDLYRVLWDLREDVRNFYEIYAIYLDCLFVGVRALNYDDHFNEFVSKVII